MNKKFYIINITILITLLLFGCNVKNNVEYVNFDTLSKEQKSILENYKNINGYYIYEVSNDKEYKILVYTNETNKDFIAYTKPVIKAVEENGTLKIELINQDANNDSECSSQALVLLNLKNKPEKIIFTSDDKQVDFTKLN